MSKRRDYRQDIPARGNPISHKGQQRHALNTGAFPSHGGLHRCNCRKCKQETLHAKGACIHCGTRPILAKRKQRRMKPREKLRKLPACGPRRAAQ